MRGDAVIVEEPHRKAASEILPLILPKIQASLSRYTMTVAGESGSGKSETATAIAEALAENEVGWIELELDAMNAAKAMDVDEAEAILRVEFGSKVSEMSSKELKRDLLVFARRNPQLFIELANDENVHLRNIGIKAVEQGLIALSQDQRTFSYANTGRKLMTVPFDEHPYSALASYFKTDEGMEVLNTIEKRL